jgi:hypothetical protein
MNEEIKKQFEELRKERDGVKKQHKAEDCDHEEPLSAVMTAMKTVE